MQEFRCYLQEKGLSERTIDSYDWTAEYFVRHYGELSKENIVAYRTYLIEEYSPKTVNQRLHALGSFAAFCGAESVRIRGVKEQQKQFLEDAITDETYEQLKRALRDSGYVRDYFAVWTMAATGLRISELLELSVANVRCGYADIIGKGGKVRRVYFPQQLQLSLQEWLERDGRVDGFLFLNYRGTRITARGLAQQIKTHARDFQLDDKVIHPHAFRHFMARKFLEANGDIALLADLLGHSSIETTRIYLRRTAAEQRSIVDAVVDW